MVLSSVPALCEGSQFFDSVGWASAWSRRDLEHLLGFFADDAVYEDTTFARSAQGKSELRKLFSRLLHVDLKMRVTSAFTDGKRSVELEWEREGPIPGQQIYTSLGSGKARGKSAMEIEARRIRKCTDSWNADDLHRIGMRTLGFGTTGLGGRISVTETNVIIGDVTLDLEND